MMSSEFRCVVEEIYKNKRVYKVATRIVFLSG